MVVCGQSLDMTDALPTPEDVAADLRIAVDAGLGTVRSSALSTVLRLECVCRRCPEDPAGVVLVDALHDELSAAITKLGDTHAQAAQRAALRHLLTRSLGLTTRKQRAAADLGIARRTLDRQSPGSSYTRYEELIQLLARLLLDSEKKISRSTSQSEASDYVSFPDWLTNVSPVSQIPSGVGPEDLVWAIVGDAASVHIASADEKPTQVNLEQHKPETNFVLQGSAGETWDRMTRDLRADIERQRDPDLDKVSVDAATFPLLDAPALSLLWHPEPFSRVRSFHQLLGAENDLWRQQAMDAADLSGTVIRWPNLLCMHLVCRFVDEDGTSGILTTERQKRVHSGGAYAGMWSISAEEQMEPGETFDQGVRRALAEELVGRDAASEIPYRYGAVIIEQSLLNTAIVVIADLPWSFKEIRQLRRTKALDPAEIRQLGWLPMSDEVLRAAITGDNGYLASELRAAQPAPSTAFAIHPTAAFRYSLAMWQAKVKTGSLGGK